MKKLISKKVASAENRQERLKIAWWIVGFVDGEGTFSVSIFRNKTTKTGWQIFPEFVVTQSVNSILALEEIKKFFGVGNIYINKRHDNHKQNLCRYCVRSLKELDEVIIPFFNEFNLVTHKAKDFEKFKECVSLIKKRSHLTINGIEKLIEITNTMNSKRLKKFLESSETRRQDLQ